MFQILQIMFFGTQPVAKVIDKTLERIIHRELGNCVDEVNQKLQLIRSNTLNGKDEFRQLY